MIDTFKVKILKGVGVAIVVILIFVIGFGVGHIGKSTQKVSAPKTKKVAEGTELTQDYIRKFLIAYYTKKDLEENRSRYKPFMTDGLYTSVVNMENEPVNQAYKGYVVDQAFKSADIFIDEKNNIAIATINYTNTLLKNKGDYKDAQKNVASKNTLRLTFTKDGKKFKVNNMSYLIVTDSANVTDTTNSYGALESASSSGSNASTSTGTSGSSNATSPTSTDSLNSEE